MDKKQKTFVILLLILFVGCGFAYYNFQKYNPKVLRKLEEVKGIRNTDDFTFPYPVGAEKIGSNRTKDVKQTTFQILKPSDEIQRFYQNVFYDKEWELESARSENSSIINKYKKDDKLVTIISSTGEDSNYTTVSIEITKR